MSDIIKDYQLIEEQISTTRELQKLCEHNFVNKTVPIIPRTNNLKILMLHSLVSDYDVKFQLEIEQKSLKISCILLKNGNIFNIQSMDIRKMLYRSFIKTSFNSLLKVIVSSQGQIEFMFSTIFTSELYGQSRKKTAKIKYFVEKIYIQMTNILDRLFPKILIILEPHITKKIINFQNKFQKLDAVKISTMFSSIQPQFLQGVSKKNQKSRQISIGSSLNNNYFDEVNEKLFETYKFNTNQEKQEKLLLLYSIWKNQETCPFKQKNTVYKTQDFLSIRDHFRTSLKIQRARTGKPSNEKLLTQISILNIQSIDWSVYHSGGFGLLRKGSVVYQILSTQSEQSLKDKKFNESPDIKKISKKPIHQNPITKQMILKVDKEKRFNRISRERQNIKHMKTMANRYLPKFYYSEQLDKAIGPNLLTDFYSLRSLEYWDKNFGLFNSLLSRLSLILLLSYGVFFLHEKQIVHRDLKLGNVLLDSRLEIKIIDFGESFVRGANIQNSPGFSFPYVPPQYLQSSKKLTELPSYDIYSLGVIILQFIFRQQIFQGISHSNLKNIYTKMGSIYQKGYQMKQNQHNFIKDKIFMAYENIGSIGPVEIMTPLLNIVQRCMDSNPNNRPNLIWITIVIKQVYSSLFEIYSM